jgi:predicted dehydrogenase
MPDVQTVRWGIIGAGSIAKSLCRGVSSSREGHQVIAVGSRDQAKADAFADEFSIPNRHDSYEALVADPEVDVVYVATPHSFHQEHTLLALDAGKPVLCEKPFAINAREAEDMVARAREKGLFLMEAMWTRFFPLMAQVRQLLKEGAIGEPRMVHADFGFRGGFNPQGRLFNPELGGGALLDVGVYPVSFASMVFGEPQRIASMATMGETGVDEQSAMLFGYESGAMSVLSTAVRTNTPHAATIMGTDGRIAIHAPWWKPERMTITRGQETEEVNVGADANGFVYEVEEVGRCLRAGRTESETLPLDETLAVMRTLDRVREPWGLRYPGE